MDARIFSLARLRGAIACLSVLGLLPATAWAEGAIRVFECTTNQSCDAAGECAAAVEQASFRLEPLAVDATGAGDYQISYGDVRVEMQAFSEAGPFFWITGNERNTLLASSETEFLWHQLSIDPAPASTIRFLSCALRE